MLRLFSFLLLGLAISVNYWFTSSRLATMPHPTSMTHERTQFYLFGSPIQHVSLGLLDPFFPFAHRPIDPVAVAYLPQCVI